MFQYNACLGSTFCACACAKMSESFNTTLVWVRPCVFFGAFLFVLLFQYNACLGSTSPVLLPSLGPGLFQYNACLGSTLISYTFSFYNA